MSKKKENFREAVAEHDKKRMISSWETTEKQEEKKKRA